LYFVIADCLPIIFFDPEKKVVALVHCGWKSTNLHLAEKVGKMMVKKYNCSPDKIIVGFGPSARKESYAFSDLKIEDHPDWRPYLKDLGNGEVSSDVTEYNLDQSIGLGIKKENIEISPYDTIKSPLFYSHYRSVRTGEMEGRFAAVVGMRK
jgi:hypothetical protein